jgi:predicted nucleic acid-binding protein
MTSRAVNAVFVDTNILVYAKLALSPFHSTAINRLKNLESQQIDFWISRQIFREYVSVMSRPGIVAGSIPMPSLTADVRGFAGRFRIAEDNPLVSDSWLSLLEQIPAAGKQVHDANIVATMLTYNIDFLLTHNTSDFTRYSGLITLLPLII